VLALKRTVRELIQAEPTAEVDLYDRVFPDRAPLGVRGARLSLFNGVVSWLMADLKAQKRKVAEFTESRGQLNPPQERLDVYHKRLSSL